jgi:hypothetical protein
MRAPCAGISSKKSGWILDDSSTSENRWAPASPSRWPPSIRRPPSSSARPSLRWSPFLPVSLLLRDRFDSSTRIARLSCPTLVIAGERDQIVPSKLSRELYDAATQPKEWIEIARADHNDWDLLAGERLVSATLGFLERHGLGPGPP